MELRMAKSRTIATMYKFFKAVVAVFGPIYLRALNEADIARLLPQNPMRGLPRMLVSIDCMY
jgi:hypothetical protein